MRDKKAEFREMDKRELEEGERKLKMIHPYFVRAWRLNLTNL